MTLLVKKNIQLYVAPLIAELILFGDYKLSLSALVLKQPAATQPFTTSIVLMLVSESVSQKHGVRMAFTQLALVWYLYPFIKPMTDIVVATVSQPRGCGVGVGGSLYIP